MNKNYNQELVKKGYSITISDRALVTGMLGTSGMTSAYHVGNTVVQKAVYNRALLYVQDMLTVKNMNAIIINDVMIYAEVDTVANGKILYTFDGKNLLTNLKSDTEENDKYWLFPVFAYVLSGIRKEYEITATLNYMEQLIDSVKSGQLAAKNTMSLFCDNFYYEPFHNMKDTDEYYLSDINIQFDNNIEQTFEQAKTHKHFSFIKAFEKFDDLPVIIKGMDSQDIATDKDIFSSVKRGDYLIPYSFEHQERIRPLETLEKYEPNHVYYKALKKISIRLNKCLNRMNLGKTGADAIENDYVNMMIVGKPGTGKTYTAYALGASLGLPIVTINLGKGTEEDKFEGSTKVVNGAITNVGSDFERIYTTGGIIILEEINMPAQDMFMGAIGQALVFPFVLKKDGYQDVKRHPLCVIIGTMNVGTAASKKINEAVSSRFPWKYRLNDPTKDDFIAMLSQNITVKDEEKGITEGVELQDIHKVYNVYDKIISYLNNPRNPRPEDSLNITLRQCLGALMSIEEGASFMEAIEDTMIGSLAENDQALADEVYENVLKNIPF